MKIKDIKKFIEVAHNKEIPKDVEEFFKQDRKGVTIEDMDFIHFVRAIGDNMNRKDFIQFRTYIDQAKKIYGLVRINKEYQEGEYIRLNKKDLLDRLDTYHLEYKEDMPLDVNTFKFYTKDKFRRRY